ncbi:MAG: YdeI/OmpD-associated family protein [Chitinophagaceae bacterium]
MKKVAKNLAIEKLSNGMHFLMVPDSIANSFTKAGHKRVICTINDCSFHVALMPRKEGGYIIVLGQAKMKQLQLKADALVKAVFEPDESDYQFEMPEELSEVLKSDPVAHDVFHSLTKGNQRSLIYLVVQVKSADKRIERSLTIAEKIKHGVTNAMRVLKK